jgi:hypothetical protein
LAVRAPQRVQQTVSNTGSLDERTSDCPQRRQKFKRSE